MKSSISLVSVGVALGASLLVLALSGCGQKGPLYMPKIPPDPRVGAMATPVSPVAPAERIGTDLDATPKPGTGSK